MSKKHHLDEYRFKNLLGLKVDIKKNKFICILTFYFL